MVRYRKDCHIKSSEISDISKSATYDICLIPYVLIKGFKPKTLFFNKFFKNNILKLTTTQNLQQLYGIVEIATDIDTNMYL